MVFFGELPKPSSKTERSPRKIHDWFNALISDSFSLGEDNQTG